MNRDKELDLLNNLMENLKLSNQAYELLKEVYAELGPYAHFKGITISQELQRKLNDFFKFDDSE